MRKFYSQVMQLKDFILDGSMLVVDPSSGGTSLPGYAIVKAGEVKEVGTIDIPKGMQPQERLHELQNCLLKDFSAVDVLVIELLRGNMVKYTLWWACGATVASIKCAKLIEIPIPAWKAVAKVTDWYPDEKTRGMDDLDAMVMAHTILRLAQHLKKYGLDLKGYPRSV